MNNLEHQLENLRTLQQSFDQIGTAAEAYNVGKAQLAANITSKGVQASASETLPKLAEKVSAIAQQPIILSPSEVGDMYAMQQFGSLTTPNYWNLYEVLANLLSDGRLVNYGGILLAEYYRGYDSLALSGAGAGGAYVVSDKDENGQFKMYTSDTTHTWATEFDGKGNRWVAYCFADEYHDFQITGTNTSPRSIFIGRKVGTINLLTASRISEIVCPDGNEYKGINSGTFSSAWNKKIILRNIIATTGISNILYNPSCDSIYIHADSFNSGTAIIGAIPSNSSIIIKADSVCAGIVGRYNQTPSRTNINTLIIDAPTIICSGIPTESGVQAELTTMSGVVLIGESATFGCRLGSTIGKIYFMYKDNDKTKSFSINRVEGEVVCDDIILQEGWCKPINVNRQSLREDGIVNNITEHILKRLKQDEPDCGDGVTITLGSTNLAKLTSEESVQLLDDLTNIYGYTFA